MKIKIIAANNSSKNVYSIAKLFVQQYDTVSSQTTVWSVEKKMIVASLRLVKKEILLCTVWQDPTWLFLANNPNNYLVI